MSRLQQNSRLVYYFFAFQTIISCFHKCFVEIIKGVSSARLDVVVPENIFFTCVEETLEQNLVRKPLLLTLMTTPLAVQ